MNEYKYTTSEEQIKKLKKQKLLFENEENAKLLLDTYGYYNIINGYRDPYIIRDYDSKMYSPGVTFEQLFSLFQFDHSIRNAVLLSMIDLEEHLRALVADIISDSFGSDHNEYLKRNNYRDKRVSDPKFSRNSVLASMEKTATRSHKQPIKYYREEHGIVPPWILMKGIYFGTLVNFIRFFKKNERTKLIKKVYGAQVNDSNIDAFKDLFSDTLFLCLEYRNLAAHGGRVYNYIPKSNIRTFNDIEMPTQGLAQLLVSLGLISYYPPTKRLNNAISRSLNAHCNLYISDIPRLEHATGLEITTEKYVWVNDKTKKYHIAQNCSGASNLVQLTYDEATAHGYTNCNRCCKNLTWE